MSDTEALYLLHTDEARQLGAMYSVKSDLLDALTYCRDLQANAKPFQKRFVDEPLREAAVVKYARCFTTGVRPRLLDEVLEHAPPHLKSTHQLILAIRSKLVAHSVNELEETNVIAKVTQRNGHEEVSEVGVIHAQRTPLLAADLSAFTELLEWLLLEVEGLELGLREKTLASARALPLHLLKQSPLVAHGARAFQSGSPFKSRPSK